MTLIRLSLFTVPETKDLNLVLAGVGVTLDTVNTCSEKCFVSLGAGGLLTQLCDLGPLRL